jgi:WS/DGAT/MGAT family acyltransferase
MDCQGLPPRLRRRVLIVSADMGGGHDATARALEEEVARLWPGSHVCWVDTLDAMGRWVGPLFRGAYVLNIRHTPWLYRFFYASLWRHSWFDTASKAFVGRWVGRHLATTIEDFDPDLILSTYPLGSAGLSWLRRHRGLGVPMGAWVSDFAPHPFWVYGDFDKNYVVHEVSVPFALAAQPDAKVEVCAPPVALKFEPGPAKDAREAFGLPQDRFIAVVSCGSYGFGQVAEAVTSLLSADDRVHVVAVCGRNEALARELDSINGQSDRLTVYGWVDDMATLLRAANIVVTNGGGATVLETMATGLPVVMYRPIAAHGEANAALMTMAGVAHTCWSPPQLASLIRSMAGRTDGGPAVPKIPEGLGVGELGRPPETIHNGWPMRSADHFFLHVDLPESPQHIGVVLRLGRVPGQGDPTPADVTDAMRRRVAAMPALRRRISRKSRRAHWVQVPDVDVDAHVTVRRLTARLDASDLATQESAALDAFWSQRLPADLPPWQILVLTGRPDGQSIVAMKLHHAFGDGVSAMALLRRLTQAEDISDDEGLRRTRLTPVTRPAMARIRSAGLVARGLWRLARAGQAPADEINRPMASAERRLVLVDLPEARVRRAAHRYGVRVSELILALAADALDRAEPGSSRESLRAMVPVNTGRSRHAGVQGNRTGAVTLDLPLGSMPLDERVARIRDVVRHSLAAGEPSAASVAMRAMGLLPSALHGMLSRYLYTSRHFNVIVSYLPAVTQGGSFAGAPITAAFPVVALAHDVPIGVAAMRWGESVGVGVLLDASLAEQADDWTKALLEALEEADPPASIGQGSDAA